jgi:hypothetical protein
MFSKSTQQKINSLSKIYQSKKDEITSQGVVWHRQIDETVKALHKELDNMQKEHESLLQKQMTELEDILRKIDEINTTATQLKKSQNVKEMAKIISMIDNQETPLEITQYSFPVFYEGKVDGIYMKSYFGYVENFQERKISLSTLVSEDVDIANHKILPVPEVIAAIDTRFPSEEIHKSRLYNIAVTDDNKIWMGGASYELKLFDFQGVLHDTVPITTHGMYLTVHNKHVTYTRPVSNTVCKVADDKSIQTMFTTGNWEPLGITSTTSDDLLICLHKDDQSKVVRYSSTGKVLQEIQYDSRDLPLHTPLYRDPVYIAENINGDIIVTDWRENSVIAVNSLGMYRFSYRPFRLRLDACAVTTDCAGHVIVTDSSGNKIHMLDRDGRFLRYIIPDQKIHSPRAVCIIGDEEIIVGECMSGIAKRIKYLEH